MVEVSNASRIVFPEARRTKGDVVAYYERLAPRILPYVVERPLSIKRFPKGLAGSGFFQKNVPPHYPASIARFEVPRNPRKNAERDTTIYPVLNDGEQLAYLANQGAIELHVPTATIADLHRPDRIVLDLDPPPNATDLVRRAAHLVREGLAVHGIETTPVATGSKGYHLVSRIAGASDDLPIVMHKLATLLARDHPDALSVAYRVVQRGKRVFIDWLRNMPLATLVVPYSLRARPNATVAVPLAWSELDTIAPDAFTIADQEALLARPDPLAASPVHDAAKFEASVTAAFDAAGLVLEPFDRFRS